MTKAVIYARFSPRRSLQRAKAEKVLQALSEAQISPETAAGEIANIYQDHPLRTRVQEIIGHVPEGRVSVSAAAQEIDEAEDSDSIETQLDLCRGYCLGQDYLVAGEFQDKAMSGSDENRPGLWAAMAALKRGTVLVVYRVDRLARDVYLSELLFREAAKAGATIEAVEGGPTDGTAEQKMVRQILQVMAEYERKLIAARTKAAMLRHQANGRRMSNRCPYGWQRDPDRPAMMLENPEEQEIIVEIIQYHERGKRVRETCRILDNRGILCRGHNWHHSLVKRVLERERAL